MRLSRVNGLARRLALNYLRKGYVEKQLNRRRGECKQCGKCCELAFNCPFLTRSRRCITYTIWRPRHCKTFPIDQKDIDEVAGECGYYFT